MYIRLVTTYCSKTETLEPKEAHIDDMQFIDKHHEILADCMTILNKKAPEIKKMIPTHLKNKDFEIIVYGNYMRGYDYFVNHKSWSKGEAIFNVQQLGLPEENRPIIKTA